MRLRRWADLCNAGRIAGVAALVTTAAAFAAPRSGRDSYLAGGAYMYSARRSYVDIRGYRQRMEKEPVSLYGLTFGKRYGLKPWLRFQLGFKAQWGSADIDTLYDQPLSDGSVVRLLSLTEDFFHCAVVPELQYAFPASEAFTPYLRVGVGLNYLRLRELGRNNDAGGLIRDPVEITGGLTASAFRPDLRGGVGLDIRFSPKIGLGIGYTFAYWRPVSYEYSVDLPLQSVDYWESFRSHGVELAITWRAR